jgi:transglutaminase-like putative cysteine protease
LRNALTIAVFAGWIAMVVALVQRQAPFETTPAAQLSALPDPVATAGAGSPGARDEWFSVQQAGRKIGWAHRSTEREGDGFVFRDDSSFALAMLGVPQTLRTAMVARTDGAYALKGFDFTLLSPSTRFKASGTTDGRTLRVRYGPEGTENESEVPLAEPIHLPTTLRPRIVDGRPADGARFTATVFSPLTLRNEPLVLVVEGRETIAGPDGPVEALRIAEEHQGVKARAWLAPDGSVLREEGTFGFMLERADADTALAGIDRDAPLDLTVASRIPLAGAIANPRDAGALSLEVQGPAASRIPSDPPRQVVADGRLRITREALPSGLPAGLPPPGSDDAAVADHLDPSPFIESDDPAIVGTARGIVGDERDPVRAAQRLVDWVADNLVQQPTMTVPSARAVLASRRGDCNEHAVLLTALARAAGIPARVAAGAMYGDDGFFYHAWSELWLGSWVSADAVFRQMPADVTHVKLIEGGPERHLALAEVIGQLSFTAEEGGS